MLAYYFTLHGFGSFCILRRIQDSGKPTGYAGAAGVCKSLLDALAGSPVRECKGRVMENIRVRTQENSTKVKRQRQVTGEQVSVGPAGFWTPL